MEKFTPFESRMVVIARDNIDTDQIIPARFLKTISKVGLGDQLFCDWRYDAEGKPKPDFVLNKPESKACQVLLAGDNFGCGRCGGAGPLGADPIWVPRANQHFVRRYFQGKLAEEFAASDRGAARCACRVVEGSGGHG